MATECRIDGALLNGIQKERLNVAPPREAGAACDGEPHEVEEAIGAIADILARQGVDFEDDARARGKQRAWTPAEDETLQKLRFECGGRWTLIASFLDGRTPDGARGRYKRLVQTSEALELCEGFTRATRTAE